ncbi:hypothetical protein [Robertkochia solimangrovi]|uniref:hypothetical protein n=1 Tax=Robertkochia solimangrovi TaxID=2213046 RepID=UPI00117E02DC|nr:hypothetical protein [Robertkochia solimangrovi]TRZ45167.1 hypothetical protein DMZ48_05295 [Robertkochia solimangrovi]
MKKLFALLFVSTLLFVSCEGDQGPPGPQGPAGDSLLGSVFEYTVSFNSGNNWEVYRDFPSNLTVYDTDVVLAYVLNGVDGNTDIWEPLPQTIYFQEGQLLTGYDYTLGDIRFFLDGTVNLSALSSDWTDNITFRVAILPADAINGVDTSDFSNIMPYIKDSEMINLDL